MAAIDTADTANANDRRYPARSNFFAAARRSADRIGLILADLIIRLLLPENAPITLVRDDKLRTQGEDDYGYGLPLITTDLNMIT